MAREGLARPVLVGGGAVEFYTSGAVVSGDFDLVTPNDAALERALLEQGFRREDCPGHLLRGYYHPDLAIGIEVVGSRLLDGNADRSRVKLVSIDEQSHVEIISVEDMIADRLAQFVSSGRRDRSMLDQALMLFRVASGIDENYLMKRIKEETSSELDLDFLKQMAES